VTQDNRSNAVSEGEGAIDYLVSVGLLKRWWCDACGDWVPYKHFEMTEARSRKKHATTHAKGNKT
jgi:hypothetical protein